MLNILLLLTLIYNVLEYKLLVDIILKAYGNLHKDNEKIL